MVSFIKVGITVLAVLAVVVGNAALGWAGFTQVGCSSCIVKIDDLTETPTVQVVQGTNDVTSQFLTLLPDTAGEFLHFTLPLPSTLPVAPDLPAVSVYSDLFEDSLGGTLSDRLLVTLVGSSLDVQFASDPASITLPPSAIDVKDVVENGNFQSLFTTTTVVGSVQVSYEFQVRSDVDVPAPATLLLVGSGLAGLGAVRWRRKRG